MTFLSGGSLVFSVPLKIVLSQKKSGPKNMPEIILKERTAHLASYTLFTRNVDQHKNTSLSQLYQPPKHFFLRTRITSYFLPVNIAKVLITAFLYTSRSSRLQMFFKIGVLKSFPNFTGKHLCWSLFLKKFSGSRLATLLKKGFNTGVFLWGLRNF